MMNYGTTECLLSPRNLLSAVSIDARAALISNAIFLVWDKIQPSLIKVLTGIQTRRLRREYRSLQKTRIGIFRDVYDEFLASQPLNAIIPECLHLAAALELKAIVDSPPEATVTVRGFDIPEAITSWRTSEDAKFLKLMKQHVPKAQKTDLVLPTSIFICSYCKEDLRYPQVLVHGCKSTGITEDLFKDLGRPWASDIAFHAVAHRKSRAVLQVCGWNPGKVTTEELQAPGLYFECRTCFHATDGPALLTWDAAVRFPISRISRNIFDEDLGSPRINS